jgi:hypothetical protein
MARSLLNSASSLFSSETQAKVKSGYFRQQQHKQHSLLGMAAHVQTKLLRSVPFPSLHHLSSHTRLHYFRSTHVTGAKQKKEKDNKRAINTYLYATFATR